ncbi:MAG: hypothetical protein KDG55_06440 [Rhodocyclaceae bacterium]|nr:hypothetical protein [Rhodocyclaceae bacterium]
MNRETHYAARPSPADVHAISEGFPTQDLSRTAALALLRQQHDELGAMFRDMSAALASIGQEELALVSDGMAHLREAGFRERLTRLSGELFDTFRRLRLREEETLRVAGMRRFGEAWTEHKHSHAVFLRQLAATLANPDRDSPGCVARELAVLIDEYWAVHALDHDHLAFSLLALLPGAPGSGDEHRALR